MLAARRHEQILSLIEKHGSMRTVDLAETFGVTDETIRRDLLALSGSAKLTRVHGGASSLTGLAKPQTFSERSLLNPDRKNAIALKALEFIEPGKSYAFDSSTTAMALVAKLPDAPFRVVSNAFAVIETLAQHEKIELITTGGQFDRNTRTFINGNSLQSLQRYHIHTALISCIGFDLKSGASDAFEPQAAYKELLVNRADEIILLIDSSKFERHSDYYFAAPRQIHRMITDSKIDADLAKEIRASGIELIIADHEV